MIQLSIFSILLCILLNYHLKIYKHRLNLIHMNISFFEEFPTKQNLEKIKLVTWPTTLIIAAKSVSEFHTLTKSFPNHIESMYWPILEKSEGYWLSPFSSPIAVQRIISDIKNNGVKVMWDAELPFRHPWLFLRVDYFLRNIFTIKKSFKEYGRNISTGEYPIKNVFMQFFLTSLGVSFSPKRYGNKKIIMYYTSMHKVVSKLFLNNIQRLQQKYGDNLYVALGTIAPGILGNEPILQPEQLEKDLQDMKNSGISEVVIFRLAGLNRQYVDILRKYSSMVKR